MKKCLGIIYSIVVVVIFVGGLFACSDENVSRDVSSIKLRLEKIEGRLASIEKSTKKVGLLESELQKLQQSTEAWERAITARLSPVSKKKTNIRTNAAGSQKIKTGKNKTYVVMRGDSLFAIAQKHQMSVDQLCRLNKITRKAVLHPGVKLLVYEN